MKQRVIKHIQTVASDRHLVVVFSIFSLICVGLVIFLALGIQPSERQVAVHYTSFGTTNFYRDRWYYLLGLVGFILISAASHVVITLRILREKGRYLALAFAWFGVMIMFLFLAFLFQLLTIASII